MVALSPESNQNSMGEGMGMGDSHVIGDNQASKIIMQFQIKIAEGSLP